MIWSSQQDRFLTSVAQWYLQCHAEIKRRRRLSQPVFRLFGYAGTGKTTLIKHFASQIDGSILYGAYTGKAAMVMRKAGCDGASTIHSMIYSVERDKETGEVTFTWNSQAAPATADLICIDEVSMVGASIGNDLLRYKKPILVIGDPAQLPPIKQDGEEAGFFTDAAPDVMLTEIHRQAKDNPIIELATRVREGRPIEFGDYGESRVIRPERLSVKAAMDADQILCGRRATRASRNARFRSLKGHKSALPEIGERIVCLRNDRRKGILNGELFHVEQVENTTRPVQLEVRSLDREGAEPLRVKTLRECWGGDLESMSWKARRGKQEFDFGYALTVHRAQGSQWDNVVLIDESRVFGSTARAWLYTGITRAAEKVMLVRG